MTGRAWPVGRMSHLRGRESDQVPVGALAQWTWTALMLPFWGRIREAAPVEFTVAAELSTPFITLKSVSPHLCTARAAALQ